jgi:hypothetical protein
MKDYQAAVEKLRKDAVEVEWRVAPATCAV